MAKYREGQWIYYGRFDTRAKIIAYLGADFGAEMYQIELKGGLTMIASEYEINLESTAMERCECGAKHVQDRSMKSIMHSFWCPAFKKINEN